MSDQLPPTDPCALTRPELARLISHSGYLAYMNTLVGNATPAIRATFDRMRRPVPGDLVLEITTYNREPWDPGALGYLVRVVDEIVHEPTEEDPYEEPFSYEERAWYVRPFVPTEDGRAEVRWHNAEFIALPDRTHWLPRWGLSSD